MESSSNKIGAFPADGGRIGALDGLRALAVLLIAWYHIWQQSWLSPTLRTPFLSFLGIRQISLEPMVRTGYLMVDLMLLLSAFLLFLPHARAMFLCAPVPGAVAFYKRRAARILPSYYLCALLLFLYAIGTGAYDSFRFALHDLAATLSFTQTLNAATYLTTRINGVLWTAAVEVQFYLLFPLLAAAFRKKPVLTYLCMVGGSVLYLRVFALGTPENLRLTLNQLPAFFGVFANGMAAACLYTLLKKRLDAAPRAKRVAGLAAAAGLLVGLCLLYKLQCGAGSAKDVPVFQAQWRFLLSLVFTLIVLSAAFSGRVVARLLGNRVMRFFAAISYNLYIWHQWIAVRLKAWRIPYWEGDTLPNMAGNRAWQLSYTLLAFLVAIAVAALVTYAVERPVSRAILRTRFLEKRSETKEDLI